MVRFDKRFFSSWFRRGSRCRTATAWLVLAASFQTLLPVPAMASVSWFSKVRGPEGSQAPLSALRKETSPQTVFDVAVSLYNDPSGDEDPDNDTGSEQQTAYEQIVRSWADGVCEESNGAHKLGRVRIFRNGSFPAADVIWNRSEHPRATPSGFGSAGGNIIFGDEFPGGQGDGNPPLDMLADPEASGYTLAHEWGHYVYGLYDEYRGQDDGLGKPVYWPRSSDNPSSPSIMNNQWRAAASHGGDLDWLNHSTSNNYQADTGQGRAYGASGWDVLVRSPKDDPRNGERKNLASRRQYTALSAVAPTAADNWVRRETIGSGSDCRSELEIVWMEDEDLEIQLVIDRSGSMAGDPIANAKVAAQTLVDVVPDGRTALGVVTFSGSASQEVAITPIPAPGAATKQTIKQEIGNISAFGTTALFDAADLALDGLEGYRAAHHTSASRVVFLLSDGQDNSSSTTQESVTASYLAADVPLITFGYGDFAPDGVLRQLADDTGGQFFSSPTTFSQIQQAFLAAISSVASTVTLSSFSAAAPPGASTAVASFAVDGTLESLSLLVNYGGAANALSLSLQSPSGPVSGAAFACQAAAGTNSCVAQIGSAALAAGGPGTWNLVAMSSAASPVEVSGSVVATPAPGRTYEILAASASGTTVTYPEPIVVTAAVSQGAFITGVEVTATVTGPDGTVRELALRDDGQGADGLAGDGIYSLLLSYDADGTYGIDLRASNAAGNGRFAREGYLPSPDVNGQEPPPLPEVPVAENFERLARLQVTVEGVEASGGDDHPDAPPGTALPADNGDLPGRIDAPGDPDYFSIQTTPGQPLAVRVTDAALGLDPVLTLFRPDGTVLRIGDLRSASSRNGYVFFVVPAGEIPPSGVVDARVQDAAAGASGGTYRISAGAPLASDQGGGTGACVAGPETLCLSGSRFAVRAEWEDFDGNRGTGKAVPLGNGSGYFWFFDPENVEIGMHLTDGRTVNGKFWVSYAALSNVMYTLRVTDTETGNTATYVNPSGQFASVRDDEALPGIRSLAASHRHHVYEPEDAARKGRWVDSKRTRTKACAPAPGAACLNGGRFQVEVTWKDAQGSSHTAEAVSLTDDTGAFRFADPDGLDLILKVLDGRGVNGRYWVFFGALSDVEYTIKVTNTDNGRTRRYVNPRGELASVGDTRGFRGN